MSIMKLGRAASAATALALAAQVACASWYTFESIATVSAGDFTSFGDVTLNDVGDVVFTASTPVMPDTQSIYHWSRSSGVQMVVPSLGGGLGGSPAIVDNAGNIAYASDDGVLMRQADGTVKVMSDRAHQELLDFKDGVGLYRDRRLPQGYIYQASGNSPESTVPYGNVSGSPAPVDAVLGQGGVVGVYGRGNGWEGEIVRTDRADPVSSTNMPGVSGFAPFGGARSGGIDFGDRDGSLAYYSYSLTDDFELTGSLSFSDAAGQTTKVVDLSAYAGPVSGLSVASQDSYVFYNWAQVGDFSYIGLFTGTSPQANRVIALGDKLGGKAVSGIQFSRNGLNANGEVVFIASIGDDDVGIFLAKPCELCSPPPLLMPSNIPEPATTAMGLGGLLVLALRRRWGGGGRS